MKIPCIKLREGPPKRFIAYPAMALLLLIMGSLPVSAQPTASFTITPAYGPAPLKLTLDASSSLGAQSYQWWFFPGGETQLSGPITEMVFNTPGIHDIVLIVKDYQGKTAMAHEIAVVTTSSGSSEGNNGTDNNGNGGVTPPLPQNRNPVADFTKTVNGFTVDLDASKSSDPDGDSLTYQWKTIAETNPYGDDAKIAKIVFQEPGNHQIILTVNDSKGGTHTKTENVTVEAQNKPPLAFSSVLVNGFKVKLDGGDSYDPEGGTLNYQWQTSDGQTANGVTTELEFTSVGSYTITLTVTDDKGATASTSDPVTITLPAPDYNTRARVNPQVIAAGISPSQVDMSDDQFNIVALVRPGSSPTKTVTFQDRTKKMMVPAMTLVGVLSNGDEFYQATLSFSPGTYTTTLKTAWGPEDGQFNIVATSEGGLSSQTYPYLKVGRYPQTDNSVSKRQATALNYDTTTRYGSQIIMAGISPAIIDNNKDTQIDVIAIVRPGSLPVNRVTLENAGQLVTGMQLAGELGNGDQMYNFTYQFAPGALGDPQKPFVELKELWGTPGLEVFGIEVIDEGGVPSHQFPDIEFGSFPEYKP